MDIQQIVAHYLTEHGYDGLYNEGVCACKLGELFPCGEPGNCKAGYLREGCNCGEGCDFHIVSNKPVARQGQKGLK